MLETSNKERILGCHSYSAIVGISTDLQLLSIHDHNISLTTEGKNYGDGVYIFKYRRDTNKETVTEKILTSSTDSTIICILPVPPQYVSENMSNHLCLRFKYPIVVDQDQRLDFYTKMPIEIGVYKKSNKKGMILIDCFSMCKQQYTLYGTPERGLICRYKESETYTSEPATSKFEEALISMRIINDTDEIVQLNKLIIPLNTVVIDYKNDIAYISRRIEIKVGTLFGKQVANVQMVNAKIWDTEASPLQSKENTFTFLMDKGF